MAVIVSYFEDYSKDRTREEIHREGPFVAVDLSSSRYRIEQEGDECPCLINSSIYDHLRQRFGKNSHFSKDEALLICDYLNLLVKDGLIVKQRFFWIIK